jgi:hypothetical protein
MYGQSRLTYGGDLEAQAPFRRRFTNDEQGYPLDRATGGRLRRRRRRAGDLEAQAPLRRRFARVGYPLMRATGGRRPKARLGMKLKKGTLRQFGYRAYAAASVRRRALVMAARRYGATTVFRKVNALFVLSKHMPRLHRVYTLDKAWIKAHLMARKRGAGIRRTQRLIRNQGLQV